MARHKKVQDLVSLRISLQRQQLQETDANYFPDQENRMHFVKENQYVLELKLLLVFRNTEDNLSVSGDFLLLLFSEL